MISKNSAAGIADVARIIIDSLPDDDNSTITIGFDSERDVTFHLAPSDKGKGKILLLSQSVIINISTSCKLVHYCKPVNCLWSLNTCWQVGG